MAYQQGPPGQPPYGPPPGQPPYPPQPPVPPGYGYQYQPPPPPPPPRRKTNPVLWVGIGVGFFVLVLIAAVVKPPAEPQRTALNPAPSFTAPTTAETTPPEPSEEPTTEQPVAEQPTEAATKAPAEQPTEQAKPPAAEKAVLPDVVGMNLQAAQDTMQATGFYVLDDQDDTGQHRLQVYDRNWVVTRQEPAAGKKVPTDTPVVLWAKKYGE